jgi:hypothetical protein
VAGTDMAPDIFSLAGRQPDQRIFMQSTTAVSGPSWPNACHISEVEIDPLTGHVAVVAYASVNDVGRVVNPMIVRGQLDGGAVQGIGQALCEHLVYDRETGQPLTGSLMDYAAPRADDSPDFKTELDTSVPCLNNPLGVKGVGELGTIGATPSVVNAVADALGRAGMAAKALEARDDRRGRGSHPSQASRHPDDDGGKQETTRSRTHKQSPQNANRNGPFGSRAATNIPASAAIVQAAPGANAPPSARHGASSSLTGIPVTISTIRQSSQRESGSSPFFPTNPTWPP